MCKSLNIEGFKDRTWNELLSVRFVASAHFSLLRRSCFLETWFGYSSNESALCPH